MTAATLVGSPALGSAGFFSLGASLLSLVSVGLHLVNYTRPREQRLIIRILLMVPIYALSSLIALTSGDAAPYLHTIRDCYEAFVIYCFFNLLVTYIGGDFALLSALKNKRTEHLFPVNLCFRDSVSMGDPTTFLAVKRGVFQFAVMKPILALVGICLILTGYEAEEGLMSGGAVYFWMNILYNVSVMIALYCLIFFYVAATDELEPFKPVPKFICIKGVIFFTFWQSIFIAILVYTGVVHETRDTLIQDYLICIEMLFFSIAHLFTFSHQDYDDRSAARLSFWAAVYDSIGLVDFFHDSMHTITGEQIHRSASAMQRFARLEGSEHERLLSSSATYPDEDRGEICGRSLTLSSHSDGNEINVGGNLNSSIHVANDDGISVEHGNGDGYGDGRIAMTTLITTHAYSRQEKPSYRISNTAATGSGISLSGGAISTLSSSSSTSSASASGSASSSNSSLSSPNISSFLNAANTATSPTMASLVIDQESDPVSVIATADAAAAAAASSHAYYSEQGISVASLRSSNSSSPRVFGVTAAAGSHQTSALFRQSLSYPQPQQQQQQVPHDSLQSKSSSSRRMHDATSLSSSARPLGRSNSSGESAAGSGDVSLHDGRANINIGFNPNATSSSLTSSPAASSSTHPAGHTLIPSGQNMNGQSLLEEVPSNFFSNASSLSPLPSPSSSSSSISSQRRRRVSYSSLDMVQPNFWSQPSPSQHQQQQSESPQNCNDRGSSGSSGSSSAVSSLGARRVGSLAPTPSE